MAKLLGDIKARETGPFYGAGAARVRGLRDAAQGFGAPFSCPGVVCAACPAGCGEAPGQQLR